MQKKVLFIALLAMSSFVFSSCKKDEETPAAPKSLYERLGKVDGISKVVDQFIANVAADPQMKRTFQSLLDDVGKGNTARVTALRNNLINQIGQASGGPEKYTGKDMVTAHKGMKITDAEFNALVADLKASLDKYMVPSTEQTELLTVLAGLKGQIVNQ